MLGLPPRCGFWKQSKWPWNMIHLMPCRNPCGLYIHHAFTYSVGPSSVVWSKLGPAPPFPPLRVLEVYWSRALSLVCKSGPRRSRLISWARGARRQKKSRTGGPSWGFKANITEDSGGWTWREGGPRLVEVLIRLTLHIWKRAVFFALGREKKKENLKIENC